MASRPFIKESLLRLNMWNLNPKNQNGWIKSAVALSLFIYFIVELALQMVINWKGLGSVEGLTCFTVNYQIISKLIVMIVQRQVFVKLVNKIEQFWSLDKADSEVQQDIKRVYISAKKHIKLFLVLYSATFAAYFLRPLFTAFRTLPVDTYHPVDRHKSPQYQLHYLSQIIIVSTGSCVMLGFDGLFCSLIIHINCEFKIIKREFIKILVSTENNRGDVNSLKQMKILVKHQNLILGCVRDMDTVYSILLLNQFLTSGICLCAGLVSVIADGYPPDFQNLSKYTIFVVTFLSQLFFYCAAGTYLITESESVSDAVYKSNWWVKTQPQLRRAFALVIQRANKSEKLTAGGMFTLDLESFTSVVRTSLSFFTLVQAMYSRIQQS